MTLGMLATYTTFACSLGIAWYAPPPYRLCFLGHAGVFVLLFVVDTFFSLGWLTLHEYSFLRREVGRGLFALFHAILLWQLWQARQPARRPPGA